MIFSLLLSLCSYRVNWGDGEPMEWFYGMDRPGPKNMDHVYEKSGTYKLQIALFKIHAGYGTGYNPTVTV